MRISQSIWFLIGLILLLAGLDLTITLSYLSKWVGVLLILLGLAILVTIVKRKPEEALEKPGKVEEEPKGKKNIATSFINLLTFRGRVKWLFPIIGAGLVILVFVFNLYFYGTLKLGVNDTITILLGIMLILYNSLPEKLKTERDFVLLFLIFLFLVLVVPITLYSIRYGEIEENSNSPFIYWLLARPTSDLLGLIGIPSSAHSISTPGQVINGVTIGNTGVYLVYKNLGTSLEGTYSSVGIGISCTGLYSVSIFIAGFIAFIFIEYQRFDVKVVSLLTLGIFTCWFANILRMTIIVVVGSYHGVEALKWTHANLGIFIFMVWIAMFWGAMFKVLSANHDEEEAKGEEEESKGLHNEFHEEEGNTKALENDSEEEVKEII